MRASNQGLEVTRVPNARSYLPTSRRSETWGTLSHGICGSVCLQGANHRRQGRHDFRANHRRRLLSRCTARSSTRDNNLAGRSSRCSRTRLRNPATVKLWARRPIRASFVFGLITPFRVCPGPGGSSLSRGWILLSRSQIFRGSDNARSLVLGLVPQVRVLRLDANLGPGLTAERAWRH